MKSEHHVHNYRKWLKCWVEVFEIKVECVFLLVVTIFVDIGLPV